MFGSEILEIVIGLIFVYLLLSLLATTINEIITTSFSSARGKILQKAIRTMLSDRFDPKEDLADQAAGSPRDLGTAFYAHPMIYRFAKKGKKGLPSYLSKKNFSLVVIDLLGEDNSIDRSFKSIEETVSKLPEGDTKTLLLTLIVNAEGSIDKFRALLENWFDEMMQRATGWYKRHVQTILLFIGLGISIIFNADTFQIAKKLSVDPEARAQIVKMAEEYQERIIAPDTAKSDSLTKPTFIKRMCSDTTIDSLDRKVWCKLDSLNQQVDYLVQDQLNQATSVLGLGWNVPSFSYGKKESQWKKPFWYAGKYITWFWSELSISKIIGWLITALAVSLGAPFWFDLLNKVMKIRGTGSKPEEEEAKSAKRQPVG
ncbi:hypothetical protein C900_05522 [Fulvivirga imtechensis AK7]|uniref:Uncharacterized protein n=1 Tax=Fulvivirga imtechensis AK7 TaxID=1237149 RepID=L8JNT4_9BACT|nr:hypothetical protein [Fulvivirga imtechensis]ELR69037.1 hypothetical protein C900_05522 [Fulvivirga imtechensis AK7]